jgi:hypothetical protein
VAGKIFKNTHNRDAGYAEYKMKHPYNWEHLEQSQHYTENIPTTYIESMTPRNYRTQSQWAMGSYFKKYEW